MVVVVIAVAGTTWQVGSVKWTLISEIPNIHIQGELLRRIGNEREKENRNLLCICVVCHYSMTFFNILAFMCTHCPAYTKNALALHRKCSVSFTHAYKYTKFSYIYIVEMLNFYVLLHESTIFGAQSWPLSVSPHTYALAYTCT